MLPYQYGCPWSEKRTRERIEQHATCLRLSDHQCFENCKTILLWSKKQRKVVIPYLIGVNILTCGYTWDVVDGIGSHRNSWLDVATSFIINMLQVFHHWITVPPEMNGVLNNLHMTYAKHSGLFKKVAACTGKCNGLCFTVHTYLFTVLVISGSSSSCYSSSSLKFNKSW